MDTDEKWEDGLNSDEMKLLALLRDSRTRWPSLYLCLRHLQDKRSFQGEYFSSWMRVFCDHAGCSIYRMWDALRAGRIYVAWAARRPDAPKIENLDVDPQNVVLIQRIADYDPSRKDELMMRLIKKQVTRRDLLEESVRLRHKAQRERLGIKASTIPWRELDLLQAPYSREFHSITEKIRAYYDNASVDGCRIIVEALQDCLAKIAHDWEENGK